MLPSLLPDWFIESAEVPIPEPVVLPVEFMLLLPEPVVPVEFILLVPAPTVPDVVAAPVLLVPVVLALVVASAAWTAANTLAMEKAAAAVVITAWDTFMINLLEVEVGVKYADWHTTCLA